MWPGQFVQVVLTLSDLTNAIVVPSQAVQTGQGGQFIYVVKPDQTVEQRSVTVGLAYQNETVVTDGQLRLAPGTKVNIKSVISSTNAPGTASTNAP